MLDTVFYHFLLDLPQAAAIWSGLLVVALVTIATLIARPDRSKKEHLDPGQPRLTTEATELRRYAQEVAVAAERAAITAQRRRADWLTASDEAEVARRAYDDAAAAARRVTAALALPVPGTPRTPAEYADRERYLHRAVMTACGRGELSALQLSDALAHRNGWDPRRHPVEQEIMLRQAIRANQSAAHRAAVARERAAWQAADIAVLAASSLRKEAFAADQRAQRAQTRPVITDRWTRPEEETVRLSRPSTRWRAARAG